MSKNAYLVFLVLLVGISASIQSSYALCAAKPEITIEFSGLSVEERWIGKVTASIQLKIEFVSQTNLMELSKTYSVGADQFLMLRVTQSKRRISGLIDFEGLLRRKKEGYSISPESNYLGHLKETLWYRYSIKVPIKSAIEDLHTTDDIYDMQTDDYDLFFFVRAAQMKLFSGRIESNQLKVSKEAIQKAIDEYKNRKAIQN